MNWKRWFSEFKTYAKEELVAHLPFTLVGLAAGLGIVFLAIRVPNLRFGEEEFHAAHFVHIFFSAAAGSAIFRSYRDSFAKAVPIAFVSSVSLCTLSDSLIPFIGLRMFGEAAAVHICAAEHPVLVALFAAAGIILGLVGVRFFRHCNRPFHLFHILISTAASVLYMITFSDVASVKNLVEVAFVLFFALAVPCLLGDVTLPLLFIKIKPEYLHEKVHHSHH